MIIEFDKKYKKEIAKYFDILENVSSFYSDAYMIQYIFSRLGGLHWTIERPISIFLFDSIKNRL